jgi:hypothetical protein
MKSTGDANARPINHELRTHAEDPGLTDAQFRLLFLLATDQGRDSKNVVLVNQGDLAAWTGSTRETVRNRIDAMPRLVTKHLHQLKVDLRNCTYAVHFDKTMADSAVTVSETDESQTMAESALTVCSERDDVTDSALTVSRTMADAAVIYSKKNSNQNEDQSNSKNQNEYRSEFEKSIEYRDDSGIRHSFDYEASEPEPDPAPLYNDEVSRLFGI